jgi:hypothetical protein
MSWQHRCVFGLERQEPAKRRPFKPDDLPFFLRAVAFFPLNPLVDHLFKVLLEPSHSGRHVPTGSAPALERLGI